MMKPLGLASLLLFSSALVAPSVARAQATPDTQGTDAGASTEGQAAPGDAVQTADDPGAQPEQAAPDISVPGGGDTVVRGRRNANIVRSAPQVSAVLSSADIARTGEGDIAGALTRVTGMSVVGNGFVYVRGLGDRYSLALMNGSPPPS